MPAGVPRIGPPVKIVQTPREIMFLYNRYEGGNAYRVIYTDGRPHPSEDQGLSTWHGHSIDPVIVPRNPDPKAEIEGELPCSERDRERLVTRERG